MSAVLTDRDAAEVFFAAMSYVAKGLQALEETRIRPAGIGLPDFVSEVEKNQLIEEKTMARRWLYARKIQYFDTSRLRYHAVTNTWKAQWPPPQIEFERGVREKLLSQLNTSRRKTVVRHHRVR
jgi:hypothetical protein